MTIEIQLEELLRGNPATLIKAQKVAFEQLIDVTGEHYVLFGAGRLGQIALAGLRKVGIEPIAFADNDPKLWGRSIQGLQVLSPQSAKEQFRANAIFVITIYNNTQVQKQLVDMGLKNVPFAALAWQYPNALTPHNNVEHPYKIFSQAKDVRKAFLLWKDDASRQEYLGQLHWMTSLDQSVLPPHLPQNAIYFPDDLITPQADEVFVDCGAFDGDSVRAFLKYCKGTFAQVIAVEPDPVNCKALEAWLVSLPVETRSRISIVESALGSKRKTIIFNVTGTVGSSAGEGGCPIQCAPLDEILNNVRPTFIKMDIEGAELDVLLGAKKIIESAAPVLAICLYHAQEHLWRIPLLIHSINDRFDFFLRRYADECWETVCYAVPKNRSII